MDATAQTLLAQLRRNPLDAGALLAVRAHAERHAQPDALAEALELHVRALTEVEGDPSDIGRLHFELGNLYRDHLGRADRAIAHYRAAIDADAAQRPAIAAARAIYAGLGKWDQVAKLLGREAESLPVGAKRAALLVELAGVSRRELGNAQAAVEALREAAQYVPGDLQIRHELATVLLEEADREADAEHADAQRREAADVLCDMAKAVSDDYAFAYVEAALDAVPDHSPGLTLLENVAPRVGRADTIPPRWVAGLTTAPEGPIARDLRLKLARAYDGVGQVEDARACLDPLLSRGDAEARELAAQLRAPAEPSAITSLDDDDLIAAEPSRRAAPSPRKVERRDPSSPLDDLAALAAADATGDQPLDVGDDEAVEMLPSTETPLGQESAATGSDFSAETPVAGEALADHGSLAQDDRLAHDDTLAGEDATLAGEDAPDEGARVSDTERPPPSVLDDGEEGAALADAADSSDASLAQVEGPDDLDRDVHGEVTQPRVEMAIPDAARGDSGDLPLDATPQVPIRTSDLVQPVRISRPSQRALDATPVSRAPNADLVNLRADLQKRLRFRDRRGAADVAEAILAHEATDAEAIAALEDHYRTTRDFRRMRDLAMRIARETAMPLDTRLARLREAAMLSESKLGDVDGTIAAWRALLAIAAQDEEGNQKLRKLYTRNARWDDLAQMLERNAVAAADQAVRAAAYRELGALHRDKRNALEDAIEAYTSARDIEPDVAEDDVVLSELYLAADRAGEAALSFEARLARADDAVERIPLLRTLAELYETKLDDDTRALETTEALLRIAPRDAGALDRLERIADRRGDAAGLIDALTRRLELSEPEARPAIYARIGEVALERMHDASRAADAYASALRLAPADDALRAAAARAFDAGERGPELTALYEELAKNASAPSLRATLLREAAQRYVQIGDETAAIHAYEGVLSAARQDQAALEALIELLRRARRPSELSTRLDQLAKLSSPERARDLRMERAAVLAEQLNDVRAARAEIERVLSELAPNDRTAIETLADLAQLDGDRRGYAAARERLLPLSASTEARIELAEALVDVYEHELEEHEGAIRVLEAWIDAAPSSPGPYLRVVPLYEKAGRDAELLRALDALATLAIAEDEAGELLLRAARVAMRRGDHDGAWNRLVPRVVDSADEQAEALLRELAQVAERGEQLAELYVGIAQRDQEPDAQTRRWMDAARTYETMVGAHEKALEAALRALAKDLGNESLLDEADRLAALAGAWTRLSQVYDAIVRRAETPESRVRTLMRHAALLEHQAKDLGNAFERVSLAFQLDPDDSEIYANAKRLAREADRGEELLSLHERRAGFAQAVDAKLEALLEACAIAQHVMADAPRATGYLARAVALVGADEAKLEHIEARVRELDEAQPPIDGRGLKLALTEVYKLRAEESKRDPSLAALLLSRASRIYAADLGDVEAAYRVLERAATLAPSQEAVLDALYAAAERAGRFEALATHFQQLADDAIDSNTASAALRRLGALFAGPLANHERAAEVYKQLVMLRPRDVEASDRLRASLKAAGRHKDLLAAIDRQLAIATTPEDKLTLLRDAAEAWEIGLENRFEARDAWKKVLTLAPEDAEALAAVERLSARPYVDVSSLLESDVVVLPEDLHPSLPPVPEPAAQTAPDEAAEETRDPEQPEGQAEHAENLRAQAADDTLPASDAEAQTATHELDTAPASEPDAAPAGDAEAALASEPEATSTSVATAGALDATLDQSEQTASTDVSADVDGEHAPEARVAAATQPFEAVHEQTDRHDEPAADEDAEALVRSDEVSLPEELPYAGASPTDPAGAPLMSIPAGSLEGMPRDTDPTELAQASDTEAPEAERIEQPEVAAAPALPWAHADEPSQPMNVASADLLAELESLDAAAEEDEDAVELLEDSSQVELDSLPPDQTGPTSLDSLSSLLEQGARSSDAPRPRVPVPPPSVRPGVRISAPPPPLPRTSAAPPPRPTAPPPPPGQRVPTVPPPPPTRRS